MRGGFTGAATPKITVKPDPPPQVEVGRDGFSPAAASRLFQLFDPHVAGRINGHVGHHLDAAALENVDDIAGLGAGRMSGGVVPGQQRGGTTPHIADPDIIIAVHVQAPPGCFRQGQ